MDDDNQPDATIRPALPSRAAGSESMYMPPQTSDPSPPATETTKPRKPRRVGWASKKSTPKPKPTRTIIRKRAKPVKKARKVAPPKNPNRPLEMKNQLANVLTIVGTLQKAEVAFFTSAAAGMQNLSRSGRRRVIAALQQVYG